MPTTFRFTEAKIRTTPAPAAGREYHKDSVFPGLQLCITETGTATYYLVKRVNGKPTRIRLGTVEQLSVEQARQSAAEIAGQVASGRDPQSERRKRLAAPTLDTVWRQWLEGHAKPRLRSWKDSERTYRNHLAGFCSRRLDSIKPAEVAAWHVATGEANGRSMANRAKALLAAIFNYAIRLEIVAVNPCRSVPAFPERSRERFLLPSEMKAFFDGLANVPDPWRDLFQISLFTGARIGNVAAMKWTEVDFYRLTWSIPHAKAKADKQIVIALCPPAVAILQSRLERTNGSPWVFPSNALNNTTGHVCEPAGHWRRFRDAAGLNDLHIHDLRRSLGSWQAVGGASLSIIGASLGHASLRSTQVYARLTLQPVRQSVDSAVAAMLRAGGVRLLEAHSEPIEEGSSHE
jgi:integrase